jgi:hypothetical protein
MNVRVGRLRPLPVIGAIAALVLALLVAVVESGKSFGRTQAEVWRLNWGFDAPEPERLERIVAWPGRDYAQYVIARYGEDAVRELLAMSDWEGAGAASGRVAALVQAFMEDLMAWYPEDRENIARQFERHPPVFDGQSRWFVKEEPDGDRLIAILNPGLRTLYVLESYR